jgi:hypothetical protein
VTSVCQLVAAFCAKKVPNAQNGVCVMGTDKAADRIVKSLNLIRGEASRLDSARAEGKSFEAKMALKTIKDECYHLRQFLHELQQSGQLD